MACYKVVDLPTASTSATGEASTYVITALILFAYSTLMKYQSTFDVIFVKFRSRTENVRFRHGQKITNTEAETGRPDPAWTPISTLGVLGLIYMLQRRRRDADEGAVA